MKENKYPYFHFLAFIRFVSLQFQRTSCTCESCKDHWLRLLPTSHQRKLAVIFTRKDEKKIGPGLLHKKIMIARNSHKINVYRSVTENGFVIMDDFIVQKQILVCGTSENTWVNLSKI